MTIYGALVPKCFELFRRKNIQNFPGLCPWTPWEGLITPPPLAPSILVFCDPPFPQTPQLHQFFSSLHSSKNWHPPKIAGYDNVLGDYIHAHRR